MRRQDTRAYLRAPAQALHLEHDRKVGDLAKHPHHHEPRPSQPQPDARRIHHSPLFWVGAVLFLLAIAIYVLSDDLSWQPSMR